MDGIFLHGIQLTSEFSGILIHLTMDDNADDPIVHDALGHYDQTFLDPGGNPNTNAHSVPGTAGRALRFDDIDDQINLGDDVDAVLGAGQDFTVSFWWKWNGAIGADFSGYSVLLNSRDAQYVYHGFWFVGNPGTSSVMLRVYRSDESYLQGTLSGGWTDGIWRHVVFERENDTFRWYVNNAARGTDTDVRNSNTLVSRDFKIGGDSNGGSNGVMDDFRVYDRALSESEIERLYNLGNIE